MYIAAAVNSATTKHHLRLGNCRIWAFMFCCAPSLGFKKEMSTLFFNFLPLGVVLLGKPRLVRLLQRISVSTLVVDCFKRF